MGRFRTFRELNDFKKEFFMGPMNLYFDFRDIFRAPRLALSGKKIWIFIVGNLAGYIVYWVFTYLSSA